MDNNDFEALARKAAGNDQQYIPAPGEAAMGIALIAGVIGRLMNESDKYELREENVKLKAQLEAQQQAQIAALLRAATPAQAEQLNRALTGNIQEAARMRRHAPATRRNGGR